MSLFSSIKNKFNGGIKMDIIIQPETLNGLKAELKSHNKDTVRFEIVSFG